VAISMATNIFFISKPLLYCDISCLLPLNIIHNVFGAIRNPKFQAAIPRSAVSLQI
jgi:hypothetical protein